MQPTTEKVIPATLIPGDGIGPEIVGFTVKVLEALRAPFTWEAHKAGMAGVDEFGDRSRNPRWTASAVPGWRSKGH